MYRSVVRFLPGALLLVGVGLTSSTAFATGSAGHEGFAFATPDDFEFDFGLEECLSVPHFDFAALKDRLKDAKKLPWNDEHESWWNAGFGGDPGPDHLWHPKHRDAWGHGRNDDDGDGPGHEGDHEWDHDWEHHGDHDSDHHRDHDGDGGWDHKHPPAVPEPTTALLLAGGLLGLAIVGRRR